MKREHVRSVLTAISTAAFIAFLFECGLSMQLPKSWGFREFLYLAVSGAFVIGAVSRLFIRQPIIIAVSGYIGLVAGPAWAEYRMSDVIFSPSFSNISYVCRYSVDTFWREQILLLAALLVSWFITDYAVKKVKA